MRILLALAISAVALFADVTGKWAGSFDVTVEGESHPDTAVMTIKQDGSTITGTAGPNEEKQFPIKDGTIEGNTIKFHVQDPDSDESPVIYVTLVIDGEKMTGDAHAERDGKKMTAKMVLTRQKSS